MKEPEVEEKCKNTNEKHKKGKEKASSERENTDTTEDKQESEEEANKKTDGTCRGSYNLCAQTPSELAWLL